MKVAIIGAGIGGLTTALALKRAGIPFRVYEAAPEIKAIGAGIILASNAMQVFRHLGIEGEIYQQGNMIHSMSITQPDFTPLSRLRLKAFEDKYGLQNHAIHRAALHDILSAAVGHEHITINKKLRQIGANGNDYTLYFEDGTATPAETVIGADGIKSRVRQQLFSAYEYRDARQVCWRGVLDFALPAQYAHEAVEAWAKGKRFGFVRLGSGIVYWYIVVNTHLAGECADISAHVRDMNPLAPELVQATPKDKIITSQLYDLKPVHTWSKNKVCLLGDAAHATTPNLGQGACQAIEDAYVLGELARKYPLREAFRLYPEIRRKKAHYIVNASMKTGKIAQWENPCGIRLRNFILKRLTPEKASLKQLDKIFRLDKTS